MEPLDPKLARLVQEGMVQAVPGPEIEQRVLQGLLARLPPAGPPGGGPGGEGISAAGEAGGLVEPVATAAVSGTGKALLLVAVLGGATAVIGGAWLGGRPREPGPAATAVAKTTEARDAARRGTEAEVPPREPVAHEPRSDAVVRSPLERPQPGDPATSPAAPQATDPSPTTPPPASSARGPAGSRTTSARPPAPRATAAPADALADEIQRIAAADAALARGDARRALTLAREHATAHPEGQLVLERTAIELSARCHLGLPGATEAATTFLREHGRAPAAAKVRARCPESNESIDP